jgi:hypothetical protein
VAAGVHVRGEQARHLAGDEPLVAGFEVLEHKIGILVVWFGPDDAPEGDTLFPGIVDRIMRALRTAWPNPTILTDPSDGEQP